MAALRSLVSGGIFFEGPRWHLGSWWVSDFYTHRVSRVSPDGDAETIVEVEAQPSGLGWLPDGSLVISSMRDQRVLRLEDGQLSVLADVSAHCGGYLNDLVVDNAGNIFVGDFGFDYNGGAQARTTSLKRVSRDGVVTVVADDLQFPNGSANLTYLLRVGPHELLYAPPPCAGCRARVCPLAEQICLDRIGVGEVTAAALRLAASPSTPVSALGGLA